MSKFLKCMNGEFVEGGYTLDGCDFGIALVLGVDAMGFIVGDWYGTQGGGCQELFEHADPLEGEECELWDKYREKGKVEHC